MPEAQLERYGRFAANNPDVVIALAIIFTLFMGYFAVQISIDTDFDSSLPQDIEVIQNENILDDTFPAQNSMILLVKLDEKKASEDRISDIRDVRIIEKMNDLEVLLLENSDVETVVGPATFLNGDYGTIPDQASINSALKDSAFVSRDLTAATIVLQINSNEDQKLIRLEEKIREDIDTVGMPGSVQVAITGGPLIETTIFQLLIQDLARTISLAAVVILFVLIIAYRSPIVGIFSLLLLIMAIIWTAGTMQILNIPLSIVTALVGSMIIGIGIDYIIHITNRYREERAKRLEYHLAAGRSARFVGVAIIATSITTIVSFMTQGLSGIPFLVDLGIALSLGIFFAMIASIFVLPAFIVCEERISRIMKGWFQ